MKAVPQARLMRIHCGEDDRWEGRPLHEAILEACRREEIERAVVYRGVEGYGASSLVHRPHWLRSSDLPIVITIVDRREKLERLLPAIEAMMGDGLIAISEVEAYRLEAKARR